MSPVCALSSSILRISKSSFLSTHTEANPADDRFDSNSLSSVLGGSNYPTDSFGHWVAKLDFDHPEFITPGFEQ